MVLGIKSQAKAGYTSVEDGVSFLTHVRGNPVPLSRVHVLGAGKMAQLVKARFVRTLAQAPKSRKKKKKVVYRDVCLSSQHRGWDVERQKAPQGS